MGRGRVFPTGRKQCKTVEDGSNCVIVELSVQEMFYSHRCFKETLMTNATKTLDTIAIFKSVAPAIHGGVTAVEVVNTYAKTLREAKIVFGKSVKTCQHRLNFTDAMKATFKGKAQKTYSNYMTSFVDAVNNGTAFSLSSSKGKGKASGKTEKDTTITPLLAKLFSHEDFKATMMEIEISFSNDEGSIEDIIRSILESEGYEIKE